MSAPIRSLPIHSLAEVDLYLTVTPCDACGGRLTVRRSETDHDRRAGTLAESAERKALLHRDQTDQHAREPNSQSQGQKGRDSRSRQGQAATLLSRYSRCPERLGMLPRLPLTPCLDRSTLTYLEPGSLPPMVSRMLLRLGVNGVLRSITCFLHVLRCL